MIPVALQNLDDSRRYGYKPYQILTLVRDHGAVGSKAAVGSSAPATQRTATAWSSALPEAEAPRCSGSISSTRV